MMMKKMKMPAAAASKKPASAGPAVELELEAEPMDDAEEAAEGEDTADKPAPISGGASLRSVSDEELLAEMKKRGLSMDEADAEQA